jgi:uncharacterized protein (TIGR02231 family)
MTLDSGTQKLLVGGITEYAQQDSFRVKGSGPATLSSIDVRRTTKVYEPKSDTKSLLDELKKLNAEREATVDEIAIFSGRLSSLEAMSAGFASSFGLLFAANEAEASQLTEMDSVSGRTVIETKGKIRELEKKLKDIDDKIAIAKRNLGKIESEKRTEGFYEVEVTVDVSKRAQVELDVTYQVSGAGWSPSYDVDLLPSSGKLRRVALLYNRTREPWEKVSLTVSTATAKPVEAIEAAPFYITAYDPEEERRRLEGVRKEMGAAKARPAPTPMPMAAPPPPAAMPPPAPRPAIAEQLAQVSELASGISVYELPGRVSVPFDNDQHPFTLVEEDLKSTTVHYWYADGMSEPVAQDEVTNGDTVIIAGNVKVYAEGDYIGESTVAQVSPREKFKIGTRVAYDVKVKKKLTARDVEKAGITKGKLRRAYSYRLEIENFGKRPIQIEVYDRVPHSLNPAIEIKGNWDQLQLESNQLGVLKWKLDIEPTKKRQIDYSYEVLWERGITISPPLP